MNDRHNDLVPPLAVSLRDVQFRWSRKSPPVLHIPHLDIARGERVFIYGPSGSGKTSLLNLLAGVTAPLAGRLQILGQDLAHISQRQRDAFRAQHIGVIFQQFNLIPYLSLLDNVLLGAAFAKHQHKNTTHLRSHAQALLQQLGLDGILHTRAARRLSLGQQQRAAVARALITRPDILIADEPSSALDSDNRDSFMELFMQTASDAGATIIFVSHDRSLQQGFTQVLDMRQLNLAVTAEGA